MATAEGNPLFIEEMAAILPEQGGDGTAVPPTIQALLAARLDRLGGEERSGRGGCVGRRAGVLGAGGGGRRRPARAR